MAIQNSSIKTLYVKRNASQGITKIGGYLLGGMKLPNVYVPDAASVTAYQADSEWSKLASKISIG